MESEKGKFTPMTVALPLGKLDEITKEFKKRDNFYK